MRPIRLSCPLLPLAILTAATAHAQYAEPPDPPPVVYRAAPPATPPCCACQPPPASAASLFRLATGPALRLSDATPLGGLLVALDIGRRAAGFRASAAWMGVGQEEGVGQYTGELWLDFGFGRRLHPLVGAGGGLARVDTRDEAGNLSATTVGVGVLRPGLQYVLPVRGTDARAGVELTGALPAVQGSASTTVQPWLMAVAAVGIGF
ncbi:MAG TPA: hypothetical protein PLU22_16345 [Polyangiaceae bacterium]|nr:hypothetical protein [Polyangiaceae bacterium]